MSNAQITPEGIVKIGTGFMAAKHMFVAVEIGLFEALAEGPRTVEEISKTTGVPARTARISVDAVCALGLVRREGDRYANAPEAQAFLTGRGPLDLRDWARFWNRVSYVSWQGLEQTIRADRPSHPHGAATPEQQELFSKGVAAFTNGAAAALVAQYDLARHRRVIDIGGGTGSFLLAILAKHPRLGATLFEIPETARVAREVLAKHPNGAAIEVVEGDALTSPIPAEHDLAILANVVHCLPREKNVELLAKIRKGIAPRGRLLLVDFWTDATHTQPVFAAMMAGEFAVLQHGGDVYSLDEARAWLEKTGWKVVEHTQLGGPTSMIVAEAI